MMNWKNDRKRREYSPKLGLPYRVLALCTGDMGFSAAKTYDLKSGFLPKMPTVKSLAVQIQRISSPPPKSATAMLLTVRSNCSTPSTDLV